MDPNSKELQAFKRVFKDLPRQGPGSRDMTLQALELLPPIRQQARIYDLGCGPGQATVVLANKLRQKILALDLNQDFLAQLENNASSHGLSELIEPCFGDMTALVDPQGTIDLIWSEGAIYCAGFDNALSLWRPLLSDNGLVACSELSWITPHPSSEAIDFWKTEYPAMRWLVQNVLAAERLGYACLDHFILPISSWWDEYYDPLLQNIEHLKGEAEQDDALARAIAKTECEIDLFRHCNREYGYVFYLLRNSHFVIQSAAQSDVEEIAHVFRLSFKTVLPFLPTLHTVEEDLKHFTEQVLPNNEVLIARNTNNQIVGFIAFNSNWINHFYVLPEYTRRGLGTRLLNIAKAQRASLRLWTFQINTIAKKFYSEHGFHAIKETDGAENEENEPDVLFEWSG